MLPDAIASDPRLYAGLVVVLALLVVAQHFLDWHTYSQIHRAKALVFPLAQRYTRVLLVSRKGFRDDDAEYLTTIDDSVRGVWRTLVDAGASPHTISSVKRRPLPEGGTQLSSAHAVWIHNDGSQTEAFLFRAPDGDGTDVYAHVETAVTDPDGHLNDEQFDGDGRGVVWDALIDAYATGDAEGDT